MKRIFLLVVLPLILMSCDAQYSIAGKDIPMPIKEFVEKHFPTHQIQAATKEKDNFTVSYTIVLSGNVYLEFNKKYEIIEMSYKSGLPDSVIPEKILNYVKNNYPDNFITGWELERRKQKIELDNDAELTFDLDGNFIKIEFD